MPTPIIYPSPTTAAAATVAVYTRDLWGDAWTLRPELQCTECSFSAAPSVSSAIFRHRYGDKYQSGSLTKSNVARFAPPARSYVKVAITPNPAMDNTAITWVGIWNRATDRGDLQTFSAVGIESLLQFTRVADSFYRDAFGAKRESAGIGMTFNEKGLPNRTLTKRTVNDQQVYIFEEDHIAEHWSTRDIVEYLLAAHRPTDEAGDKIIDWIIEFPDVLPDYDRPEVKSHGRDLLSLFHSIIARHRLLSFTTRVLEVPAGPGGPASSTAFIQPFTFTDTAIDIKDVAGGVVGTIPANQFSLDLNLARDTTASASVSIDASHVADQIQVTGGERQSVFSVSHRDFTIGAGWTEPDDVVVHKLGATLASDYPAADEVKERERRDRAARSSDALRHVFSHFLIPRFWDQETLDGEGGGSATPIAIDESSQKFYIPRWALAPQPDLPLLSGYDYSGTIIAANVINSGHRGNRLSSTDLPAEPLPILAVIRYPDYKTRLTDPARYIQLDQIGKLAEIEEEGMDTASTTRLAYNGGWSGRVSLLRDRSGFVVDVRGQEQHILAKNEYGGHDDEIRGSWDWRDMIFTVATKDPRPLEVNYPETPTSAGEFMNLITIEVGSEYKRIYVVPDTIVGLDETTGELQRSDGGELQDDRDYLHAIAMRAYQWYKVERYALTYDTSWIDGQVTVGDYVNSLFRRGRVDAIGSVITTVSYSFPVVSGTDKAAPRVRVQTQFGELDPLRI